MKALEKQFSKNAVPFWRNKKILNILWQVAFLVFFIGIFTVLIQNALNSLERAGIKFGFNFLSHTANFQIGEKVLSYQPTDSYQWALVVGFANTLKVVVVGIIIATIFGIIMGIARLSSNWLARTVSGMYVEVFRNTPVLVQIFIWYFAVFLTLPKIEDAQSFLGIYFSNRGLVFPWFGLTDGSTVWFIIMAIALIISIFIWKARTKKQVNTGQNTYPGYWVLGCLFVFAILSFAVTKGMPLTFSSPVRDGFAYVGGYRFSPEFAAILFGLVFYTASYITEIVRGGIQSVSKGQIEASKALGMSSFQILRFVTFPQAIRTIIPPVTSQYLNLAKNSSLAVAVGYPDLFNVGSTVLNQSGKAIEMILIMLTCYLVISLITSLFMNIYNSKTKLVER